MNISSNEKRLKKKIRIRKKVFGTSEKPRLVVFRSLKNIYAQVIDDNKGNTLVAASSKEINDKNNKTTIAEKVGLLVGKKAVEKGITKVVFDRNGYIYHGRVKAVSKGARDAGLNF